MQQAMQTSLQDLAGENDQVVFVSQSENVAAQKDIIILDDSNSVGISTKKCEKVEIDNDGLANKMFLRVNKN